jgi:hypothetical protein
MAVKINVSCLPGFMKVDNNEGTVIQTMFFAHRNRSTSAETVLYKLVFWVISFQAHSFRVFSFQMWFPSRWNGDGGV